MSQYYTNVYRAGNYLFVREIKNGKHRKFKCEYKPTLYVPAQNGTSLFHAPDGTPVEPFQPGSMSDCYEVIKNYEDVDGFKIYGNTGYEYAYIQQEYPGQIEYDMAAITVADLDIEVACEHGFSEPDQASEAVTAITYKNSQDGKFHVFGYGNGTDQKFVPTDPLIVYHECEDEVDMLDRFLTKWDEDQPDIVTGWNVRLYDIPYLVNRISRIMKPEDVKRMSPWRIVKETTVTVFGKDQVAYDLAGISIIDYLLIYRKNVLEPRESYKLDYIAEVELKEKKVNYEEYGNLHRLFKENYQKFMDYNVHDVRLVDRIDAKRKLIELQLLVAYHAKVNYVDVLSQVRVWDTLIVNKLLDDNVVVPQRQHTSKDTQYAGAFVMDPIVGMHDWVVSFDVTSLYPSIMRTLNMGIETKVDRAKLPLQMRNVLAKITPDYLLGFDTFTVEQLQELESLQHELRERDLAMGCNGIVYNRDPKSFYSAMIEDLFNKRVEYKKKAQAAKKQKEETHDPAEKTRLDGIVSNFDLKQKATKVLLNSLYGACGNQYFRFFDIQNAEAVTLTGQFIIQRVGREIEKYLNAQAKKGQKVQTPDVRYVIYSDTDSIYISLSGLVKRRWPNGGTKTEIVDELDKLCKKKLEPEIDRIFREITADFTNGIDGILAMKREVIADKAIWTAKKRYILNVWDNEGVREHNEAGEWVPKLKVMGLEISKSSVPKFCRDKMKEAVKLIMEADEPTLWEFVSKTKEKFLTLPIENVSFPRSVNGLGKYGDAVTIFGKGTPFHTKGALVFNHMLTTKKLTTKYPAIREGEKIKFFYLKEPNPFKTKAMAFLNVLPWEFEADKYIDWETQWDKSFVEPLMLILTPVGWNIQQRASLDGMWE